MTVPVQRKLPGTPIPRKQLIAEWEDLRHRNLMKGPVASFLFDVHYSVPEKIGTGEDLPVAHPVGPAVAFAMPSLATTPTRTPPTISNGSASW